MTNGSDLWNPGQMEQILSRTMKHEGGFVDDPADSGGATNYGISLRFLQGLGDSDADGILDGDIDRDGDVDADDVTKMTRAQAAVFYVEKIGKPLQLSRIPGIRLRWKLFDLAVNVGQKRAVKILQSVVGVAEDGILGDQTIAALIAQRDQLNTASSRVADQLILFNLARAQVLFYRQISQGKNLKFLRAWIWRAMDTADDLV